MNIAIRNKLAESYSDVYTSEVLTALAALAHFNNDIKSVMTTRLKRRAKRQQQKSRIGFLDPEGVIPCLLATTQNFHFDQPC